MNRYIIRRILQSLPTLLMITIITFTLTELAPGDAVSAMILMEAETTGAMAEVDVSTLRAKYGLDKPAPVRYVAWLGSILQGNMGVRIRSRVPVATEIGRRLPRTAQLMMAALLISLVLGIPLGIFSALKQYSVLDYIMTWVVFFGISVPGFFLGMVVIYTFAVRLDWFPTGGYGTIGQDLSTLQTMLDRLRYMILPAGVLGFETTAGIMRYTRSSMLEVIRQDYITVARSKGLGERSVTLRHALRNALLPLITVLGMRIPRLFGGSLFIETLFSWPGMSVLYRSGVESRDYPLIMGVGLISAVLIVVANLVTDLAYAAVDPRIRYE